MKIRGNLPMFLQKNMELPRWNSVVFQSMKYVVKKNLLWTAEAGTKLTTMSG